MEKEQTKKLVESWILYTFEEIRQKTSRDINDIVRGAEASMKDILKQLKEQADIAEVLTPMNMLDVLARRGVVRVFERDVEYNDSTLNLSAGGQPLIHHSDNVKLEKGKYRIIIIAERKGDLK